jgi:hypothetical protein
MFTGRIFFARQTFHTQSPDQALFSAYSDFSEKPDGTRSQHPARKTIDTAQPAQPPLSAQARLRNRKHPAILSA